MNKQKITVLYRLSDEAIRNYFLAGDKKEKIQEIVIETDNEYIISQADLVDNERLIIRQLRSEYFLVYAGYYFDNDSCSYSGYNDSSKNFKSVEEFLEKENLIWARNDNGYITVESEKILTQKDVISIFAENEKIDKKIDSLIESKKAEFEKNQAEYDRLKKEAIERKEKQEAELKEKKEKEESVKKSMIDDFVEKSGSETLKLRKELGYDYEGLAIQEKTDQIELQGYEKIIDSDDIDAIENIKKPRLELMKLVKDVRQLDYVENADAQIWTKKLDYEYDYDENPEKIEVLKVEYSVFNTKVIRYYIVV